MTGLAAVLVWLVGVAAVAGVAAEFGLRAAGFGDFPLYQPDPACGYRMAPDQAGRFRNRIGWRYDHRGLRSEGGPADFAGTTLLLGDSVVDGGLMLDQRQTLAHQLAARIGSPVYPVACHGWALANALGALEDLTGWQHAARLVLVINTGDLDANSSAQSALSFPVAQPRWLLGWLIRRHIYRRGLPWRSAPPRPALDPRDDLRRLHNQARFGRIVDDFAGDVLILRYPMRDAYPEADDAAYCRSLAAAAPRIRLLDMSDEPAWTAANYADHVHPTAGGTAILASVIAQHLR